MVQKIFLFGDKDGIFFFFLMEEEKAPDQNGFSKLILLLKQMPM